MKSARSGSSWSGSETNRTFLNTGGGQFSDASYISGFGFDDDGRALAITDWDGDGDLDLWAHNRTAPRLRLLRNSSPKANRSVAFRLEGGNNSNRDAIGARLKLTLSNGSELLQTLRAGSGFLSQSSKWIHFGIDPGASPSSLHVIWPDGVEESFSGIAAGERYRLTEGGVLRRAAPRAAVHLGAARQRTIAPQPLGQMVLPGRIPLPEFRYIPAGKLEPAGLLRGEKPLLITLFSGTCESCTEELHEFAQEEERIKAAGLEVLALSVDKLVVGSDHFAADKLVTASKFPFPTGTITPLSADHLRFLLKSLYDFPASFSVPISLLLDEERRLFAIYRGRVSTDLILHDVAFSKASDNQLRDLSVPFPGSWFTTPIASSDLAELIASPFHRTFPDQGLRYLEHALTSPNSKTRNARLKRRVSGGYYRLAWQEDSKGSKSKAVAYYKKTLAINPSNSKARTDFGALLGKQGKLNEAEAQFRMALELDPDNQVAKKNLELVIRKRR
ncbi:ASPIC/UnbV domain-containing protein [Akkermansiaceae bacterium]|nr:ASPIC/UnbV domain-containing protein [Akkermansiaceae bacterium]MDB4499507.1 ASPIC/UnbV domain-containing protein [Akkermansiaceae bacterium]